MLQLTRFPLPSPFEFSKVIKKIRNININDFIHRLDKAESILNEVRDDLLLFDNNLQESIARGEKDISEGRMTICKTEKDINNFF